MDRRADKEPLLTPHLEEFGYPACFSRTAASENVAAYKPFR
jgi:hypothetical protein